MSTSRTRTIAELGLAIAMFAALQWVFKVVLPINVAGGSISLSMLPVYIVALRRGLVPGLIVGALCGLLDMLLQPTAVVHPAQFILDYPVAFGALGLAGVMSAPLNRLALRRSSAAAVGAIIIGCLIGGAGRFAAHFASGIVFFGSYAPKGQPVWIYSAVYNLSYLVPSVIACTALAAVLVPVLARVVPVDSNIQGGLDVGTDSKQRA